MIARNSPALSVKPVALKLGNTKTPQEQTINCYGYTFQVPWKEQPTSMIVAGGTSLIFDHSAAIYFINPNSTKGMGRMRVAEVGLPMSESAIISINSFLAEAVNTGLSPTSAAPCISRPPLVAMPDNTSYGDSPYEALKQTLEITPAKMSPLFWTKASKAAASQLISKETALDVVQVHLIYSIEWNGIRGFQVGDPQQDPHINLMLFNRAGDELQMIIAADSGNTAHLHQEDINEVIETFNKAQSGDQTSKTGQ